MALYALNRTGSQFFIFLTHIVAFLSGIYLTHYEVFLPNLRLASGRNSSSSHSANKSAVAFQSETLQALGWKHGADKITWHHYDSLYDKYLERYRGSNVSLLEIGLGCGLKYGPGRSASLWRDYLGTRANIHFIEYNQRCGEDWFRSNGSMLNVTIHYGSQEDVSFLLKFAAATDYFDVIIDDGGHTMKQQVTSFLHLSSKVRSGGVYLIEDLETSYEAKYGGGYRLNTTMIEMIKVLVDDIQSNSPYKVHAVAQKLRSFELGDGICAFNIK